MTWRGRGDGWRSKPWFYRGEIPPEMSVIIAAIAAMRHLDMDKARFLAPELWGMRTSVITVRHCWKGYNPCRHLVWITLYLFWGWETHWIESNRCCWVISISFARRWRSRMRCWRLAWTSVRRGKPPYWSQNNTNGWGSLFKQTNLAVFCAFSWGSLEHQLETWWVNLGKRPRQPMPWPWVVWASAKLSRWESPGLGK